MVCDGIELAKASDHRSRRQRWLGLAVALVVCAIGASMWVLDRYGPSERRLQTRAKEIGEALVQSAREGRASSLVGDGKVRDVVNLGDSLAGKLNALRTQLAGGYSIEVRHGDAFGPIGSAEASHHLIITANASTAIGIRLRYDRERDAFHIVGFWSQ